MKISTSSHVGQRDVEHLYHAVIERVMRDLRLAVRALLCTPLVSILAVLSLALGIGANTAVFSLVNSLLLRTLPVSNPERLVTVSSNFALAHGYRNGIGWNYDMWRRFEQERSAFDDGFAWTWATFNLSPGGPVEPVRGMIASGSFFSTLGVPVVIGRTFTPADDVRGGGPDGPVAVISSLCGSDGSAAMSRSSVVVWNSTACRSRLWA